MHKVLLIIFLLINSASAYCQAEFSFKKSTIKFPKTKQGAVLKGEYEFTNTGNQPLIISEIKVTCPCTKYEFPKEPIMPGATGVIKVIFDTKDAYGWQDRNLDIYSNAKKNPVKVRFKVQVEEKK